jgi:hypothetical protein
MKRTMRTCVRTIAAALLICGVACSDGREAAAPAFDAAGGLARCRTARAELDEAWRRLDAARAALVPGSTVSTAGAGSAGDRSTPEIELAAAQTAFDLAYGDDQAALTEFLNAALRAGKADQETAVVLDLYADSAIRCAADVITHAGDYRRAVDLLETARGYFADARATPPPALLAALERARRFSVITRARFDRLARGMTDEQVKALVGVPHSGNVHRSEVAGKQVTSWLYRSEDGGVSALYFDDSLRLYAWRWNVRPGG